MALESVRKIHFIGIGGIGMSALARHFLANGVIVSGSDRSPSPITNALVAEGVHFFASQVRENITPDIDFVVYTEAMAKDHEEVVAAREQGIRTVNYFEALGLVANEYYLIAVCGSHGKTTTTSMLIDIFEDQDKDPSAVVGSLRSRTGKNYRQGKSKYFIVEACEYKRDFLHLRPQVVVITNVEAEHLDYYKDLDDVISAFNTFVKSVPEGGAVICNRRDPVIQKVLEGVSATVIDYTESLNLLAPMKQPGLHNRMDGAAAVAAAHFVGLDAAQAQTSVQNYAGSWRRFEYKGKTANGAIVYTDYGHHPSEIRATLQGARELYPDKRLVLVYEPHMYSRTHALFEDFVTELGKADELILMPIYAAREDNLSGVTSEQLAQSVAESIPADVAADCDTAIARIRESAKEGDVVLTMGAGDVYKIADSLVV